MAVQATLPSLRHVYLVTWGLADLGGMERHMTELAKSLRNRHIGVTVFCEMPVSRSNQYRQELRRAGIPLVAPHIPKWLVRWWQRRFPASPANATNQTPSGKDLMSRAMGPSLLARLLRFTLERHVKRTPPELIHVHGCLLQQWVVTWCATRGLPAVYTEHSTVCEWGGPPNASAPEFLAPAADVACVSESARRSLSKYLHGRPVALHRHIVRLPDWKPATATSTVRILTAARLSSEKRIDILLHAAAQLRSRGLHFSLEIVGDGPLRRELTDLSNELGLADRVVFSGSSSTHSVQRKMAQADVFVLASQTESLPMVLLEAMSHGLALVATAVGGVPELISHGETGLLVPALSASGLAEAIEQLITNGELRARLGANARKEMESGAFSEAAAVSSVLASYEKARRKSSNKWRRGYVQAGGDR